MQYNINQIKIIFLFLIIILNGTIVYSQNNLISIEIQHVVDGDTLECFVDNNPFTIRLYGIDCYETDCVHRAYKQAYINKVDIKQVIEYGMKAKNILSDCVKDKKIYMEFKGTDRYGRVLAILYDNAKTNINNYLLKYPYCFTYKYQKVETE